MVHSQTDPFMNDHKTECDRCGCEMREDEGYWAEGHDNVCSECYHAIVETCQLCGDDDVMPSGVSEFILVKNELARTATRLPGIYRIKRRPFLCIPMIGGGSLLGADVVFVDRLPKPDREYEISGHVCKKCAQSYAKRFRAIYGDVSDRTKQRGGKYFNPMCERERVRVASVARRHPTMLRDLEEDAAYTLAELRQRWDLPRVKAWHDWLLLEHKGVKVYAIYPGDRYGDSWLSLRPEPRYRNDRCREPGVIFCASGLPTYPQWGYEANRDTYHNHYDYARQHSRPAIIAAIDRGLLTQTGVRNERGELVECR